MKRILLNALVDIGCLVAFIPSLLSGLVLYLFLPSGGGRRSVGIAFLGIPRSQWVAVHDYSSLLFASLLLLHLLLHAKFFLHIPQYVNPAGGEKE